jgi:hypothetical protein
MFTGTLPTGTLPSFSVMKFGCPLLSGTDVLTACQLDKFLRMHVMAVRTERALLRHRDLDVLAVGDISVRLRTLNQVAIPDQSRHGSRHGELPQETVCPSAEL